MKCENCGKETKYLHEKFICPDCFNGGEQNPVKPVVIPADIWAQVEKTAKECQRRWGMGFPTISITLLKKILKGE